MKNPKVGDKIEHTCALNGTCEGKVVNGLAMQFVYTPKDGTPRFLSLKHNNKPTKPY